MTEHMTAAQLGNWVREFAQWYPALRVLKFYGTKEERALIRERDLQVRVQIIGHARTKTVGKYQSCMF